jgi:hypothetical protein
MKNEYLNNLEKVEFTFGKDACSPKSMTCSKCNRKMDRGELDIELESGLYARLNGFCCPKCRERMLDLKEAKKLDRLMVLNRMFTNGFKLERSLSFDGDNYTLRIPKEFTHLLHDKKIDIVPLSNKEFYGRVR